MDQARPEEGNTITVTASADNSLDEPPYTTSGSKDVCTLTQTIEIHTAQSRIGYPHKEFSPLINVSASSIAELPDFEQNTHIIEEGIQVRDIIPRPLTTKELLDNLRKIGLDPMVPGLSDEELAPFLESDPDLREALLLAESAFKEWQEKMPDLSSYSEQELHDFLIDNPNGLNWLRFYNSDDVCPYVPLVAKGPWIITMGGGVILDNGGYGMNGFGHNPTELNEVISKDVVQANIMTVSAEQRLLRETLENELSQFRSDQKNPYQEVLSMMSGSEALEVAARIIDTRAKRMTDPEGPYAGRKVAVMSLNDSFHGRTRGITAATHSCHEIYNNSLKSFEGLKHYAPTVNDIESLERAFQEAEVNGDFISFLALESVMGEGNAGEGITREFYDRARELTKQHGTILLIDNVQAGLRTTGRLSITSFPGFEDCEAPDVESFSKAINGGTFPASLLLMSEDFANNYQQGTYGSTNTAHPRGLKAITTALQLMTPEIRQNISNMGNYIVEKLEELKDQHPDIIKNVQGTGLLISVELDHNIQITGKNGVERESRAQGHGIIHSGEHSLRFTPWFHVNKAQADLMIHKIEQLIMTA